MVGPLFAGPPAEPPAPVATETAAMAAISAALEPLDTKTRRRVLAWAADRHGVDISNLYE
jgi:hypothetical protein